MAWIWYNKKYGNTEHHAMIEQQKELINKINAEQGQPYQGQVEQDQKELEQERIRQYQQYMMMREMNDPNQMSPQDMQQLQQMQQMQHMQHMQQMQQPSEQMVQPPVVYQQPPGNETMPVPEHTVVKSKDDDDERVNKQFEEQMIRMKSNTSVK